MAVRVTGHVKVVQRKRGPVFYLKYRLPDGRQVERLLFRERLLDERKLSRRSVQKVLVLLHGILKRAKRRGWITTNPAEDVERVRVQRSGDFNVLAPAEVAAVARAAASEQDAAVFTVAAFTGLRLGELRRPISRTCAPRKTRSSSMICATRSGRSAPRSGRCTTCRATWVTPTFRRR